MADFDPVSYMMGQKAGSGGGGGGSTTLAGLTDVDISNPSNGQTLVYNSTSGKWENGAGGGGGSYTLFDGAYTDDPETITLDTTCADLYTACTNGPVGIRYTPQEGVTVTLLIVYYMAVQGGYVFITGSDLDARGAASDAPAFSRPH